MASDDLSRRVGKGVGYPPLCEMGDQQRREFHEALLEVTPVMAISAASPASATGVYQPPT